MVSLQLNKRVIMNDQTSLTNFNGIKLESFTPNLIICFYEIAIYKNFKILGDTISLLQIQCRILRKQNT
jgi:hypothetical protein